ncbi:hypothetical protein LYZ92_01360 [Xanthomonas hortorum pv. taraxaci]|nr:hypothetical protein [Xanthomonas hortorum pv. taraxaci]
MSVYGTLGVSQALGLPTSLVSKKKKKKNIILTGQVIISSQFSHFDATRIAARAPLGAASALGFGNVRRQ